MNDPSGYWGAMPPSLRRRFVAISGYCLVIGILIAMGLTWATVLLPVPIAIFAIMKLSPLVFRQRSPAAERGLVSYTVDYLWSKGALVRWLIAAVAMATSVAGLAWIGTSELRAEKAKPGWSEHAAELGARAKEEAVGAAEATVEMAGDAKDSVIETGRSWTATVKGWFD